MASENVYIEDYGIFMHRSLATLQPQIATFKTELYVLPRREYNIRLTRIQGHAHSHPFNTSAPLNG